MLLPKMHRVAVRDNTLYKRSQITLLCTIPKRNYFSTFAGMALWAGMGAFALKNTGKNQSKTQYEKRVVHFHLPKIEDYCLKLY